MLLCIPYTKMRTLSGYDCREEHPFLTETITHSSFVYCQSLQGISGTPYSSKDLESALNCGMNLQFFFLRREEPVPPVTLCPFVGVWSLSGHSWHFKFTLVRRTWIPFCFSGFLVLSLFSMWISIRLSFQSSPAHTVARLSPSLSFSRLLLCLCFLLHFLIN